MPTIANPAPTVAAAVEALAALHDRLIAGDATVTPDQYAAAENAVAFARVRQEAARRAEEQREEAERRASLAAATERLAAMDTTQVERTRQQLAEALDAHAVAVLAWAAELGAIQAASGVAWGLGGSVRLGAVERRQQPFQSTIRDLAEDVVRRHFGPRAPFGLAGYLPD